MRISRSNRRLTVILIGALIAAFAVAGPVVGKDRSDGSSGTTVEIPLQLDCSTIPNTPEARSIVRAAGLCGQSAPGGVTAETTVIGNCGSLSLNLFNSGGGWMQWKAVMTSSLGPFIAAGYSGSWDNLNAGQGGVGRGFGGLTSDWVDIFPINTGAGRVTGQINTAWDRLWWGGLCTSVAVVGTVVQVT